MKNTLQSIETEVYCPNEFFRLREKRPNETFIFNADGKKYLGCVKSDANMTADLRGILKYIISSSEPPFIWEQRNGRLILTRILKTGKIFEFINYRYRDFCKSHEIHRFSEDVEIFWKLCLQFPECWTDSDLHRSGKLHGDIAALTGFERLVSLVRETFNSLNNNDFLRSKLPDFNYSRLTVPDACQKAAIAKAVQKSVQNFNNRKNRTIKDWTRVIEHLSQFNSTMLVYSIDLFYRRKFDFNSKQFIESASLDEIRIDIKTFLNKSRRNSLFKHLLCYFLILDVCNALGPVYRAIFVFQDNEATQVDSFGDQIGAYWNLTSECDIGDFAVLNATEKYAHDYGLGRIGRNTLQDKARWDSFVSGYIPFMVNGSKDMGLSPVYARTKDAVPAVELIDTDHLSEEKKSIRLGTKVFSQGKGRAYPLALNASEFRKVR